jgi:hypothetical protein
MIWWPCGRQVANHALGIGPFGHVFDEGGLDLAAQGGLDGLAALFVLARPARFGDGRDIDESRP